MSNVINWFEIPAANFDRAVKFYSDVFACPLHHQEMGETKYGFFPAEGDAVSGAIAAGPMYKPSAHGSVVYLNGGKDLAQPLSRVESAGGKIVVPKTKVSDEVGYIAMFSDSEGNTIALHSKA